MIQWLTAHPLVAGVITFFLMWSDWLLTILQEQERQAHYSEHYQSYPINTIEGNPLLQSAVHQKRLIEPKHIVVALMVGATVTLGLSCAALEWREPILGYVWGLFLIVDTTHLGNLIGYRASRQGLHGKLYLHLRTAYLAQMGRYIALAVFLTVLAICSSSLFIVGVAVAGLTSALRQMLWLRRVPSIPEDDRPPDLPPNS